MIARDSPFPTQFRVRFTSQRPLISSFPTGSTAALSGSNASGYTSVVQTYLTMTQPYLQVVDGGQSRRVPLTQQPVTFGRLSTNSVVIEDTLSSRNHCVVERVGAEYRLTDLKSRNGTMLNGHAIAAPATLNSGDIIKIGAAVITFVDPSAADDQIEELSEADLIDESSESEPGEFDLISSIDTSEPEPQPSRGTGSVPMGRTSDDPEKALSSLADSLPESSVRESDISLANSRGQVLHAGKKNIKPGSREPVDIFRLLLLVCIRSRATDIHLEPRQDAYHIRLRVDGLMVDVAKLTSAFGVKMAALVKVLSDVDIAQRNALQEGHFSSKLPSGRTAGGTRRIDYRVSFAPSVFGQKLVIRILDAESAPLLLGDLRLPRWMHQELSEQITQDAGMVIVAGPTGSGKTTTLYALLRSIDLDQRNAVTIEDPVEIQIDRTTQMPVDEGSGKSFGTILRSVLRQDPDIIMVGEIRDAETARTAMQAAITGHMVLSTIHTKDTLGTVFRLLDLGVEPYLVSQGLNIVIAQRLVRALCPACKKKVSATPQQKAALLAAGAETDAVYIPHGCPRCLGTGHAGRRGVFELLRSTDKLKSAIQANPSTSDLEAAVKDTPYVTLLHSGLRLVAEGVAAFDEVQRIASRDVR